MEKDKFDLILASGSPRRKELLGHLKLPFKIITADTDEISDASDPKEFCKDIALEKGKVVFDKIRLESGQKNMLVVSADTIVCLNGKIYGKPKNKDEARKFLSELAGKTHSVMTAVGIHLLYDNREEVHSFVEESHVTFNEISDYLMEKYLATGDSLDKAGAYGIQGPSLTFISKVSGDYANVVGFPLSRFVVEFDKILRNLIPDGGPWENLF